MTRFFLAITLLSTLTGCSFSKSRAPHEVQEAHARAAEFRQNVIKQNVEIVVEDLLQKLEKEWLDKNTVIFEAELLKLKATRDEKIKASTQEEKVNIVVSAYAEYDEASDKLRLNFKKATEFNHEALKKYKDVNLGKIKEQFDKSQRVDLALMRYMMGLKPGPFDKFLVGSVDLIEPSKNKDK
jgi:hypothetical protein